MPTRLAALTEHHYSVKEVAKILALSPKAIRCQFRDEPGVLRFGKEKRGHKRDYVTLRIPANVLERVYRRMMRPGSVPSADQDNKNGSK